MSDDVLPCGHHREDKPKSTMGGVDCHSRYPIDPYPENDPDLSLDIEPTDFVVTLPEYHE